MARVGIICGSDSDLEKASDACKILDELGVPYDLRIASAHRTPELLEEYMSTAEERYPQLCSCPNQDAITSLELSVDGQLVGPSKSDAHKLTSKNNHIPPQTSKWSITHHAEPIDF